MNRTLPGACVALILLTACASYTPTAAPVEQATDSDLVFNADGYGAKVDPYLDQQRQKQYFNADFTKAGFLVVDVVVKNEGKDPIDVKPYDIYLVFPGGNQMAPLQGQVVATQIEEGGSVVGSVLLFGVVGGLVATSAEQNAKNARIQDYSAKQLKETTLVPGASTQGYLFYRWTPSASAQAEFAVQVQDHTNNHLSEVIVPLGTTKPFAVPQSALFVQSAPPANPPAASGSAQTASMGQSASSNVSTGPVDVPFRIDNGVSTLEGIGKLDRGRFTGETQEGAYSVEISGRVTNGEFAFDLSGHFCTPTFGANASSVASAKIDPAVGNVSALVQVTCAVTSATRAETMKAMAYFDFPAQGTAPALLAGSQGQSAPAVTAAASGGVDVPFRIDYGSGIVDGTARLENGHLLGQSSNAGRAITVKGTLKDGKLLLEIDGPIESPAMAEFNGYYCSGSLEMDNAAGKVTIPFSATCGTDSHLGMISLELPPAS